MSYVRFVRPNIAEGLHAREGFFCAAYALRNRTEIDPYTSERLEELLSWFRSNLAIPKAFDRSKSKGAGRKYTPGLSWFKEDAAAAIARSFELIELLKENGYPIEIIRAERIGFIVYEDHQQVVAEPFSDTPI